MCNAKHFDYPPPPARKSSGDGIGAASTTTPFAAAKSGNARDCSSGVGGKGGRNEQQGGTPSRGGGRQVTPERRAHGVPPSRSNTSSTGRSGSRRIGGDSTNTRSVSRPSRARDDYHRSKSKTRIGSRSKSRDPKPRAPRREYDTPFDDRGRCHYHKNVQLAAKKMTGGWKVVHSACPRCMEDNSQAKTGGGEGGDVIVEVGEGQSVSLTLSRGSNRASATTGGKNDGCASFADVRGLHDKNGCCMVHTHIQVAKKRVLGTGFKIVRACPACSGGRDCGLDDSMSVSSKKSTRSSRSNATQRSGASASARGGGGGGSGGRSVAATGTGWYGALPFDGDGYCCRHPSVQLAKKKVLGGGFKIVLDFCPHCASDCGSQRSGGKKNSSSTIRRMSSTSSQGTGRVFDDSGAVLRRSSSRHRPER